MIVAGIDPSFANTAIVSYCTETNKILSAVLIETTKTKNKQIRASSDAIARCRHLYTNLTEEVNRIKPDVIIAETPSGSQSAASMKGYGISCCLLASLPMQAIEVTPIEVKVRSVGDKKASKATMIEWANKTHPETNWIRKGGKIINKNEHIADAIAAIYAGMKTPEFERLLHIHSSMAR